MNEEAQTAVRHLLWIWLQYGGGYKTESGVVCLPHQNMQAGERASEFLTSLALGNDTGFQFELNAAGLMLLGEDD